MENDKIKEIREAKEVLLKTHQDLLDAIKAEDDATVSVMIVYSVYQQVKKQSLGKRPNFSVISSNASF